MAAGIALYGTSAHAEGLREGEVDGEVPAFQYTSHPATTAVVKRRISLFVDRDFDDTERQRIVAALRQWNYVLNGFVGFQAQLLPADVSQAALEQLRRRGGWIVARVDSRHPVAQRGDGLHALAVTVSNSRGGGYVYVISDRLAGRDLTGVIMHEFGHVLGAGHDQSGLMAPVYSASGSRCIDYSAVAMVAQAQHLSMRDLNWCETPRYEQRYEPRRGFHSALKE